MIMPSLLLSFWKIDLQNLNMEWGSVLCKPNRKIMIFLEYMLYKSIMHSKMCWVQKQYHVLFIKGPLCIVFENSVISFVLKPNKYTYLYQSSSETYETWENRLPEVGSGRSSVSLPSEMCWWYLLELVYP